MQQPLPKVGFVEANKRCFKNFAKFDGRIRRSEYWWFYFLIFICNLFIFILSLIFLEKKEEYEEYEYYTIKTTTYKVKRVFIIINIIINLIVLIPHLSAMVRRLHDTGKSGVFVFFIFIPLVGFIILIVFLCEDSVMEQNQYGPCPKYETSNTNGQGNYQIYQIPVQPQTYNPPQYYNNTNAVSPYQEVPPNPQGYVPPNYTSP